MLVHVTESNASAPNPEHTGWFIFEGRGWRPCIIHQECKKSDGGKMNICAVTFFFFYIK